MSKNVGLLYNKEYFKDLKFNSDTGKVSKDSFNNRLFFDLNLNDIKPEYNVILPVTHFINNLSTCYPGLLTGSGYAHEIGGKEIEDELKLGFFFDYTTGLPCIPGSSVKGLLRSACEKDKGHYIEYIIRELADEKRKSELKNIASEFLIASNSKIIVQGGNKFSEFVKNVFENEGLSAYKHDIFFDAFPIASGNENGKFLSHDYITHHENPIKNPNPVQFLKVLPKVVFQFNFRLSDIVMPSGLKIELYRQILLDLGIGAKTNVGYGQFSIVHNNKLNSSDQPDVGKRDISLTERTSILDEITRSTDPVTKKIIIGSEYSGKILSEKGDNLVVEFYVEEQVVRLKKKKNNFKGNEPGVGKMVSVKFNAVFNNDNPNFSANVID